MLPALSVAEAGQKRVAAGSVGRGGGGVRVAADAAPGCGRAHVRGSRRPCTSAWPFSGCGRSRATKSTSRMISLCWNRGSAVRRSNGVAALKSGLRLRSDRAVFFQCSGRRPRGQGQNPGPGPPERGDRLVATLQGRCVAPGSEAPACGPTWTQDRCDVGVLRTLLSSARALITLLGWPRQPLDRSRSRSAEAL